MGDVVELGGYTRLPIAPDKVLQAAVGELDYVLVLGYNKDGTMYAACSESDLAKSTFLATHFAHRVHAGDFGEEIGR